MKKLILIVLSAFFVVNVYSQTVENLRVEPEGDKILIHYRIGGSVPGELYNVELECSIDGGPRFQPKAVTGAVGKGISGGNSDNVITWDVFEDVEEVGNAEFFIKIERAGGAIPEYQEPGPFSQPQKKIKKTKAEGPMRKIFINYELTNLNPYGIKAGTLGKWGFYGSIRYGGYSEWYDPVTYETVSYYWGSLTAGATRLILNRPKYRLHGFAGLGMGDAFDLFDIEFGISNVFLDRLVIDVAFEYPTYGVGLFGIGILF